MAKRRYGGITATVWVHTGATNATIGVQLNAMPEVIVACPLTPQGLAWSPCAPAALAATAGVSVVRLRSIGWTASYRAYAIANVSFALAS